MKALVVGCGSIGRRHLTNLRALGVTDLLAYDPRPESFKDAGAQPCASLEEGLKAGPNLVVITTPTSLHLEPAMAAARAGCHLFIEKPLAASLEGTAELAAEVSRRKLVALVGCNMRFHPGVAALRRLVRTGALGKIMWARALCASYLPEWRPSQDYRKSYSAHSAEGGGIILDGIHEIDYLLDILGPAKEVFCASGRLGGLEIESEDTAAILLRMKSGALSEIHLDFASRAYRRGCQISGSEGLAEWDFDRPELRVYSAATRNWTSEPLRDENVNQMYLDELRHLLSCLEGKEKPAQDIEAARAALAAACAAKRSTQTGRWETPE
jgi:predicted dehydrogenase